MNKQGRYDSTWFRKNGITDTLKVPMTPGSDLANEIKKKLKQIQNDDQKTLVIESTGRPATSGLRKLDPFDSGTCPYNIKCLSDDKTKCSTMNTTYQLTCTLCQPEQNILPEPGSRHIYKGCSGRSLHKRLTEHQDDVRTNNHKNAMSKHMTACHKDIENPEMHMTAKILSVHNSVLHRVVDECHRLENDQSLANSKGEWGRRWRVDTPSH